MRLAVLQVSSRLLVEMFNKTALLILLVTVAAAEGRARGAKLGHRLSRQNVLWGRPRQDQTYPQTPAVGGSYNPQIPTAAAVSSYPSTPAAAPNPSPVATGNYQQTQTIAPVVVPGVPPVSPSLCKYPGFFPTPGSCVNFYRCVDFTGAGSYYTVFQFNCPAGTIFDDDLDICNHIAWTIPKRPECADMLQSSLVPLGSGPKPGSGAQTGGYTQPSRPTTLVPFGGGSYPKPGSTGAASNPDAPPKPFSLQCYADELYRRHPIYCNRYYKCTWDGADWVFPMLTCPQSLIFSEAGQLCTDQSTTACDGRLAPYPSPEVIGTESPTTDITTTGTEEPAGTQVPTVEPNFECAAVGYYPFEGDCVRFYKCVQLEDSTELKPLLYKCPGGYGYSEEKKRCDKDERLPTCTKTPQFFHLRLAPARQLTVNDLLWFFSN